MRRRRGSATILSRKQILTGLAAIAIAVVATLPQGPALAEWKDTPSATAGTPTAPARGIFGSGALESRGLEITAQWNRIVERLPKLSATLTACAADPARCTAPPAGHEDNGKDITSVSLTSPPRVAGFFPV